MMRLILIAACAKNGVIGRNNQLIWHIPEDFAFFKQTTSGFPILMGRKTFESIGRPLPQRTNIVITRDQTQTFAGCEMAHSLPYALQIAHATGAQQAFLIGGAQLYQQGISIADELILTKIEASFSGDAYFPAIDPAIWQIHDCSTLQKSQTAPYLSYRFVTYRRQSTS